jgi:hypothetical protein
MFSSLDPVARVPAQGRVGGTFSGEWPADQEDAVKAALMAAFNDMLAGGKTPLLTALADLAALGTQLSTAAEAGLGKLGARGKATVAFASVDPTTEAALRAKR